VNGWLLDTNVVSELFKQRPHPRVVAWIAECAEPDIYLSALVFAEIGRGIVKLELSGDPYAGELELAAGALRARYEHRILPIDDRVLAHWGRIMGRAAAAKVALDGIDQFFAATAASHGLTLVTRNVKHFPEIVGVPVVDPWTG
jgi:toxin FitB